MKVLVTGASGQLGQDVIRELREQHIEYLGTTRDMLDLTDKYSVHRLIIEYRPDIVVHCAAYTAVDKAEEEIELCRKVNVDGTRYIVDAKKSMRNLCISALITFFREQELIFIK